MDIRRNARRAFMAMFAAAPCCQLQAQDSLIDRWNRFAHTGNEFAKKMNAGDFDLKLARRLSQEWREVENNGEWPK